MLPSSCLALGWLVSPQHGVPVAAATVPMPEPEPKPKPELELELELVPGLLELELEPKLLEQLELVLAQALEQVLVAVVVEPPPTASASRGPQSP
eukprot:COSAG06_NODE_21714_length_747_cov_8.425926_2_plen_94_part_01